MGVEFDPEVGSRPTGGAATDRSPASRPAVAARGSGEGAGGIGEGLFGTVAIGLQGVGRGLAGGEADTVVRL